LVSRSLLVGGTGVWLADRWCKMTTIRRRKRHIQLIFVSIVCVCVYFVVVVVFF
jgi:uncharacterized membrane protein YsdA (DUF1294 family)